jgi:hypothetical protein
MNRLLLISSLVGVATLTTSAGTVEIPREFQGRWCESAATDEMRYSRNPTEYNCETYDSGMTVTAAGYTGHKAECAAVKVSRRRGGYYRMEFVCQTGELIDVVVPLDRFQTWHLDRGDLVIK